MIPRESLSWALLIILTGVAKFAVAEDDPLIFRAQGMEALRLSETDPDAIVTAAIRFTEAFELYDARKDDAGCVEMNSYLYWCRKKMSSKNIDDFLRDPKGTEAKSKFDDVAKALPASEAQGYFDRAEKFAADHPNEPLAVAIRYFEVADRFAGTPISIEAQKRSLDAQQLAMKQLTQKAPTPNVPAVEPRPVDTGALLPVPDPAAVKAAEKGIKDVFKDDYAKTLPREKAAFVQKLLKEASDAHNPPESRYVLWRDATAIAAQGGDFEAALSVVETMGRTFKFDPVPLQRSALKSALGMVHDAELSKTVSALIVLLDKPDDAAANLTSGKYYCFTRRNWTKGLPFLRKGSDSTLKTIAEQDLMAPTDAAAMVALGDSWFDLGEKQTAKNIKAAMQMHAKEWYDKCLPDLSGLQKIKLEHRITQILEVDVAGKANAAGKGDGLTLLLKVDPKNKSIECPASIRMGAIYEITATGAWTCGDGKRCGPEGQVTQTQADDADFPLVLGPHDNLPYLGQNPRGGLYAQIGTEKWTFYIGKSARFFAPKSGKLVLRMNDDDGNTDNRQGAVQIQIRELTADAWKPADGVYRICARVDAKDYLYLLPTGVKWEYGGSWGRVGLHDGYYPTVLNGIYWWPNWVSKDQTEVFKVTALFPPPGQLFQMKDQHGGKVTIVEKSDKLIKCEFEDTHGNGSHLVSFTYTIER